MADKELADAARLLSRVASRLSSTPMTTVSNTPASDASASLQSNSNQNLANNTRARVVDAASELRNLFPHHFQGRRHGSAGTRANILAVPKKFSRKRKSSIRRVS